MTDQGLAHLTRLPRLRHLVLSGCAITDAGGPHLKQLQRLETLQAHGVDISEEAWRNLRAAIPNLKASP